MQQFTNILLYLNKRTEKNPALFRACELAKINGAKLSVIDVIEDTPNKTVFVASPNQLEIRARDIRDVWNLKAQDRLQELANLTAPYREQGVEVAFNVLRGFHFVEIIREVLRKKHDLLIKNAEGPGGIGESLFGTTDTRLIRKCPTPLWIIKPSHYKPYHRILAAVDPDLEDDARNTLNDAILGLATAVTKMDNSELNVIHCWNIFKDYNLYGTYQGMHMQLVKLSRQERNRRKQRLLDLVAKHSTDGVQAKPFIFKKEAKDFIPRFASKRKVELVVMGTVCRTGIQGFLIGNTAETVLPRLDCSLLVVKPHGFVSPVTLEDD
jgi:nucleotide-binding universal stress UspA family protein